MTTEQAAVLEKKDGVAVITLNRPEVKNCCNNAMATALQDIMDEIDEDRNCFVAVIHGAGGNFSTGADLKEAASGIKRTRLRRGGFGCFVHPLRKPLIAAVEGYAVAGGTEILQAMDLRVAGESAIFGVAEVRRGLFPLGGSTVRLRRQIPYTIAAELLLTGRQVPAREALEIGLIGHVVPDGQALATARELADQIAANGPLAVQAVLKSLRESANLGEQEALANELEIGAPIFLTNDAKEGPTAFSEKREPNFTGT